MFGSMLGTAGVLATITAWLSAFGVLVVGWVGLVWLLSAILVAVAARHRGQSALAWLLLAVVLTPLLAALLLSLFPDRSEQRIRQAARRGRNGWRLCPSCGEAVRSEARRCRYCLFDLTRRVETAPAATPVTALSDRRVEPRLQ
ncbi:MAG: hypothetical protein AB7G13_13215 [Lautropia sp.]